MRSNPTMLVECDKQCGVVEELGLTPLPRSAWDERSVDAILVTKGWNISGGKDICPECARDAGGEAG